MWLGFGASCLNPEVFQVYIEDALGDRVWVDLDSCKELVANMCTLFGTKPCGAVGSVGVGKTSAADSKASSSDGSEVSGSDAGEEVLLSGIETAPRYDS